MTTTVDGAALAGPAAQLRIDSILARTSAGSGRPGSSMSAADLMAVPLARHLRWAHADDSRNAHLILSMGHAPPRWAGQRGAQRAHRHHPAAACLQLAVRGLPGCGSPAEVMDAAGTTAPHIVARHPAAARHTR